MPAYSSRVLAKVLHLVLHILTWITHSPSDKIHSLVLETRSLLSNRQNNFDSLESVVSFRFSTVEHFVILSAILRQKSESLLITYKWRQKRTLLSSTKNQLADKMKKRNNNKASWFDRQVNWQQRISCFDRQVDWQ